MMPMRMASPGSLPVRLGACLAQREECRMRGDLAGMAGAQDDIATYCSVKMSKDQWQEYEALPRFAYGDSRQPVEVKRDLDEALRFLLRCMKPHNVFAKDDVEMGDSSDMDQEEAEVQA